MIEALQAIPTEYVALGGFLFAGACLISIAVYVGFTVHMEGREYKRRAEQRKAMFDTAAPA